MGLHPARAYRVTRAQSYLVRRVAPAARIVDVPLHNLRRFAIGRVVEVCRGNLDTARIFTGHRNRQTLVRYLQAQKGEAAELVTEFAWTRPSSSSSRTAGG